MGKALGFELMVVPILVHGLRSQKKDVQTETRNETVGAHNGSRWKPMKNAGNMVCVFFFKRRKGTWENRFGTFFLTQKKLDSARSCLCIEY